MSKLTDNSSVAYGMRSGWHIPFTAYIRVVPKDSNRRSEVIRDLQKIASRIEDDLNDANDNSIFDFAKPIAETPQFGNYPARITIHGHMAVRSNVPKQPLEDQVIVSDNQFTSGHSSLGSSRRIPVTELNFIVSQLKNFLLNSSTYINEIIRINVMGVTYGIGGFHFPK